MYIGRLPKISPVLAFPIATFAYTSRRYVARKFSWSCISLKSRLAISCGCVISQREWPLSTSYRVSYCFLAQTTAQRGGGCQLMIRPTQISELCQDQTNRNQYTAGAINSSDIKSKQDFPISILWY
jgi:hypothetical protein